MIGYERVCGDLSPLDRQSHHRWTDLLEQPKTALRPQVSPVSSNSWDHRRQEGAVRGGGEGVGERRLKWG